MNFLTKTFESLTGGSIPYSLGERQVIPGCIWNIYDATSSKDGSKVTVFEFDLKNPKLARNVQQARNSAKRMRALSLLPGTLNVVDTIENDNYIYIVTERVRPYEPVEDIDLVTLGIYQIANAIKYVNVEGSSVHCNVCKDAVFITDAGEWKLGGFELLVNMKEQNYTILSTAYQLPSFYSRDALNPPEFQKEGASFFERAKPQIAVKFDAYKFGVLVYELLNPAVTVTTPQDMADTSNVPRAMLPHLKKCLSPSVSVRYSVQQFLKFGEASYLDTPLIDIWKGLDELALKDQQERLDVFQSVDEVDVLPPGMYENRILPELIATFRATKANDDNIQSILLYSILKQCANFSQDSFDSLVKQVIFHAFTLPDRAIRMTLLGALPQLVERLSNYEIQDKVFPNLVQGFNDTNVSIREETIKSVLPIVSKISDRQLNNELLRYLARLQNDDSDEIRTNVIVCLTKVAEHMNRTSRPAVLVTAFNKALKDKFVPTRLITVEAFGQCLEFFTPEVCCSRILSALAPALLDKSSKVREEAEKTFEMYMEKIREEAATLPIDSEEDSQQAEAQSASLARGLTSLSLSNSAKLFGLNNSTTSLTMKTQTQSSRSSTEQPAKSHLNLTDDDDDNLEFDDGWGDDDDVQDEVPPPRLSSRTISKPASRTISKPASRAPSGSKSLHLQPKAKSKLQLELEMEDDDGWGDNAW